MTDQIQTFLTSVQQDRFAALFLLELTTGIRHGQVCGLKWTAVDLSRRNRSTQQSRGCRGVRAGQGRWQDKNADQTISIDRGTIAASRRWREVENREREFFGNDYHPGDYVFTFDDGRAPHPDTIRQRFDRLAAAAGRRVATSDRGQLERQTARRPLGQTTQRSQADGASNTAPGEYPRPSFHSQTFTTQRWIHEYPLFGLVRATFSSGDSVWFQDIRIACRKSSEWVDGPTFGGCRKLAWLSPLSSSRAAANLRWPGSKGSPRAGSLGW
jgi:hypothetical protein